MILPRGTKLTLPSKEGPMDAIESFTGLTTKQMIAVAAICWLVMKYGK